MTTATTTTIVGVFRDRAQADKAIQNLVGAGISRDQISAVASDTGSYPGDVPKLIPDADIGSEAKAGTGAAVGGFFGFIAGMVALAIPGIGPIIAAGPLAAGIMGAGLGAAAGGITGALKDVNVPPDYAQRYSEAVRAGRILLAVHVPQHLVDDVADIMDRSGALDIDQDSRADLATGQPAPIGRVTEEGVRAARLTEDTSVRNKQREREVRVGVFPGITGGTDFENTPR
jgi:hypothetical protein